MRIATSTIYDNQINSIDNLVYQQQQLGNDLSTGKTLNEPSDDPTQIGEDLSVRATIASQNTLGQNMENASSELTAIDGSLSNLTNIIQSARQLAIEGASDSLSQQQRQAIGAQIDQLLNETVTIANTQYNGRYVFAGTSSSTEAPVQTQGVPVSSVTFSGNFEAQSQVVLNGQTLQLSTSLRDAFNYDSTDGSPDVFQTLINLRDTLDNGTVVDQSSTSVNQQGTVINTGTLLGSATFATPLSADSSGNYSIDIDGLADSGPITLSPSMTMAQVVSTINLSSAVTGVTASFDYKTERLSLSSDEGHTFTVSDVETPSPPATTASTNTANFVAAFGLNGTADMVQNVSTQLNDIDNVLNVALDARATIGGRIDVLNSMTDQNNTSITDNTQVQSQIEDGDVASLATQFSQTQTALEAAYSTTSHLESKILFDYISTT